MKEKCTTFMGVPTMYIGLLEAAKTSELRPTLRMALSGGAALPVAVLEKFTEVFGTQVAEGYGLTETSPVATFNQIGFTPRPGTVGKSIWGVDVQIARAEVEQAIELLPTGELGEIVVRGHNVSRATSTSRRRRPRRSSTGGFAPVTSGRRTTRATSRSSTARRTWSFALATTSTRPMSRRSCCATRPSVRWR